MSSRDVDGSFEMRGLCLEGWKSVGRWRGDRRDELAGTRVLFLSSGGGRGDVARGEGTGEVGGGEGDPGLLCSLPPLKPTLQLTIPQT